MNQLINNVNQWERYGKGKIFQFYITNEEFVMVLEKYLPAQYAPYTLICPFMGKIGNHFDEKCNECSLEEFFILIERGYKNFFIRSMILSPVLEIPGQKITKYLVNKGLINLMHGHIYKNGWGDSSISIVNKVINVETGTIIEHKEYEKIFNALKRGIRKLLKYKTYKKWQDGRIVLERNVFMSHSFAEKVRSGEIYTSAIPGEPL